MRYAIVGSSGRAGEGIVGAVVKFWRGKSAAVAGGPRRSLAVTRIAERLRDGLSVKEETWQDS